VLDFPAGSLVGTTSLMSSNTPSGTIPSESVRLSLSKQTLQWKTGNDSIAASVPGLYDVVLHLGSQSYRTAVHFDENGGANAISAVRPCFVLAKGSLKAGIPGADTATFGMLLNDASFIYQTNDTLRIRVLQGTNAVVDRDFTALGQGKQSTDKFGKLVFTVQTISDASTTNHISKFSYSSAKGKLTLAMSGLDLSSLTNGEDHVTIELTVGNRVYPTGVTFFGSNPGSYSTSIP
jgi:hypothetical protein